MKFRLADKIIAWLALLSGLSISTVAVYYSVAGLISIFAAAVIPIAIMGVVLEIGKLVSTIWLKQNWFIAPRLIKSYLLLATAMLMMITSMGIFGFLSKAHMDQTVSTTDVSSQVSLIDEKIKTQRENIEISRKALAQMNAQVDARLSRGESEQGAERAVQIRRQQTTERNKIQNEIAAAQKEITNLQNQRAPIASQLRKVEAEVGPIKYIAALIYGDSSLDQSILEKAVRWVTILIVVTFDPLAIALLLASQHSFNWFNKSKENDIQIENKQPIINEANTNEQTKEEVKKDNVITDQVKEKEEVKKDNVITDQPEKEVKEFDINDHAYLKKPWISNTEEAEKKNEELNIEVDEEIQDLNKQEHLEKLSTSKKRNWKHQNPGKKIKYYEKLYELKLIDKLPWDDNEYEVTDPKSNTYIMIDQQDHQKKKTKFKNDE